MKNPKNKRIFGAILVLILGILFATKASADAVAIFGKLKSGQPVTLDSSGNESTGWLTKTFTSTDELVNYLSPSQTTSLINGLSADQIKQISADLTPAQKDSIVQKMGGQEAFNNTVGADKAAAFNGTGGTPGGGAGGAAGAAGGLASNNASLVNKLTDNVPKPSTPKVSSLPFGGMIKMMHVCNTGLLIYLGPPTVGTYMWTPATKTFLSGPPKHPGQWLLGMAGPPVPCYIADILVGAGRLMTMVGSSL